tara:strand:+ start:7594 stop:7809 length:216 start_codon:yes stop_codon:yes gene_type:complete
MTKFKVEWKEGYPECDPQIVSLEELKQEHWNLDAYGDDVISNLCNLDINESLDVVGVTDKVTFTLVGEEND